MIVLAVATALFLCSSASTYAVNDVSETTEPIETTEMIETVSPTGVSDNYLFRTCTNCGGTVYLYCTGSVVRTETVYDCNIPSHNEDEPCRVEKVYCGTSGYCVSCYIHPGVSTWPFDTEHFHIEYHYYYGSQKEPWGSCIFRA